MARVGLNETEILAGVRADTFPKPIKFDGRVVWKDEDIREWVAARVTAGDKTVIALQRPSPAMDRLIDALAAEDLKEILAEERNMSRRKRS
jgi:predicted DNA-binding transcriptional regulator AlpA